MSSKEDRHFNQKQTVREPENTLKNEGDGTYQKSSKYKVQKISEIDERDKETPDDWIPRHPELIRLTGRHPLNAEPATSKLLEEGLLTPNSLHYVRNHAPV